MPSAEPTLARLEIHAASNEYSSVAVTVTNLTLAPIRLGVRVEDLRGGPAERAGILGERRNRSEDRERGDCLEAWGRGERGDGGAPGKRGFRWGDGKTDQ